MNIINKNPDIVLIDDDSLIRSLWEMEASSKGIICFTFSTLDSFLEHKVEKNVPIYVDYCMSNDNGSHTIAPKLIKLEYLNVYITTGLDSDTLNLPYEIKGIIGKEFPKSICTQLNPNLGTNTHSIQSNDVNKILSMITHDIRSTTYIAKTVCQMKQKNKFTNNLQNEAIQELNEKEIRIENHINNLKELLHYE